MSKVPYVDFVDDYLVKDGMLGNALNMNKAPDQLKIEVDENSADIIAINTKLSSANLERADKYLASQNIAKMIYDGAGDLTKIRYKVDADTDYEVFTYSSGDLSGIAHYVGGILKGNSVLSYTDGNLTSVVFTGV